MTAHPRHPRRVMLTVGASIAGSGLGVGGGSFAVPNHFATVVLLVGMALVLVGGVVMGGSAMIERSDP